MMKYCCRCIMPSSRPEQVFDNEGVCDACRSAEIKHKEIDWDLRRTELECILGRYRGDGVRYDCIIPVSGGKDSTYQALAMRDQFGMNPLCVNHLPCDLTEIGWQNLLNLRDLGFDLIHVGANRRAYREMVRVGFFKLGDCCWPEHIGIFTAPVRVAVQYEIPLLVWGENPQFEYGGPAAHRDNNFLDHNWLEQFQMLGYRVGDMVHEGVDMSQLNALVYPSDEEIRRVGVTGLFLGYFQKWDSMRNLAISLANGWQRNPDGPVEGAYNDVENLDCKWIGGLHDYMKYLKYGYGRATDQLCIEIRAGRMTRAEAVIALRNTDQGTIPWRYVPDFLEYLGIQEAEFLENLDRFTNRRLFELDEGGRVAKDANGNPILQFSLD